MVGSDGESIISTRTIALRVVCVEERALGVELKACGDVRGGEG